LHLVEHLSGDSLIHRLDPRLRIGLALAFAVLLAVSRRPPVLILGLGLSLAAVLTARLGWRVILVRLGELNLFMVLILILLPFSSPGEALFRLGSLSFTREGLYFGLAIAAKGNAIVIMLTVLLSTIEATTLGHALSHLRVPAKLIHLYFFTVRYLDLLHHEYVRLARAMKARCFKPGLNRHTYRSLGYLVAVLLVRSLDRSERIMAAMKCRGFRGRLYLLDHFAPAGRDVVFGLLALAVLAGLGWLEWS